MGKSLYSLILNDEIVSEIDRKALWEGTNRSALINRILAEQLGMLTPEMRLDEIFGYIGELIEKNMGLVPVSSGKSSSYALKSCLDVKYRPTVRYEISLSEDSDGTSGTLNVYFRTTSGALLSRLVDFFKYFVHYSKKYKPDENAVYSLENGRFQKTFRLPAGISGKGAGEAILDYVRFFDGALKDYISYADPSRLEMLFETEDR